MHACGIKLGFVNRRVVIRVMQGGLQTFELQDTQLVDAGFLNRLQGQGLGVHGSLRGV